MQYAGIQILANACASRIKTEEQERESENSIMQGKLNEIGFITAPCCKNEKKDAYYQKESYVPIDHCKECRFGECIRVFKIIPSLAQEEIQIL